MPVRQNLYQIYKLPSSLIVKNNCNIPSYTIKQARAENTLISISDNLVFHQIRKYYNDLRTPDQIYDYVQSLRSSLRYYRREGLTKEANNINNQITQILFVKDIINIEVIKKSDYKQFGTKGFDVNGVHYRRFCCGSGQMRRNTITFINEELYNTIFTNLMCDLGHRISEFNLAKYHAYFALAFSSVLWVRTPRVCVIKDYYRTLKDEPVDFITKKNGKSIVERRVMDLELNCADGQGLIDPQFACKWAEDMAQDYVPSSFVIRSVFIKGNLVPFDFREYAKTHGIDKIYDKWGRSYPVDEIDVILSESQFKMHKYYSSWQEYKKYADAADIKWGVARYNRKHDDEFVQANYQYIQTLGITKEDTVKMIQPTIDWIHKICSGDELYGLLFAIGGGCGDLSYDSLLRATESTAMKAVIKNRDFIKDGYIQAKMYKTIARLIEKAKIGKIWVHGNYQFMISDPVAQCQSALGMDPVGCIGKDEVWSRFWQERSPQGCVIDACRSPLISEHEHNPMKVVEKNEERDYWLQYIQSGMIYNTYDSSTFRHEDSDFDLLVEIKVGERT